MENKVVSRILIVPVVGAVMYFGAVTYLGVEATSNREAASNQARNYQPASSCTIAVTQARHTATGLEHEFATKCIPEGWELVAPKPTP